MEKRILRTPSAAEYVGLSASTLEKKRLTGDGPRFVRLGGRAIGYDVRDLDAWLDQQRDNNEDDGSTASAWQG
ncbi:MAG: AlpA family phage regulatory protein [bacterium]|nr:AlpA family phage regulatory protein [bacterium]